MYWSTHHVNSGVQAPREPLVAADRQQAAHGRVRVALVVAVGAAAHGGAADAGIVALAVLLEALACGRDNQPEC